MPHFVSNTYKPKEHGNPIQQSRLTRHSAGTLVGSFRVDTLLGTAVVAAALVAIPAGDAVAVTLVTFVAVASDATTPHLAHLRGLECLIM